MSNSSTVKTASVVAVLGIVVGMLTGQENLTPFIDLMSDAAQSEIAKLGFCFTLAAWIHSGRVKKEIRSNFMALTISIDKVADTLREDLKMQGARLDNLASRVQSLEQRGGRDA